MNENRQTGRLEFFQENFELESVERYNENTTDFLLWSVGLENRFVATVESVSDLMTSVTLLFRAEDAEEAQSYFTRGLDLDLSNPEVDSETWLDTNELWLRFDFVWADDEADFEDFLNGLSH